MAIIADFNAAPAEAATRDLLACCESITFAKLLTDGRPYPDQEALDTAIDTAFNALSWDDIVEAMDAHPRIGARTGGISAAEQAGATAAGAAVRQALVTGNQAYEQRFGHVFLICATGLSGQEMLDALRQRLHNGDATEQAVVRQELLKITKLRVRKVLSA
ncbi:MAG TPA: 2-oxo-4-hydroxy-4-carboxy-5-ureidoimidazoline decarboxylase [Streptosporangiaceae bacterium]|jgi:2-oxo-4-hydroxy-4-carboxy-5-ureidoimidazoline decarboxylase